jgi:hypothetical protein
MKEFIKIIGVFLLLSLPGFLWSQEPESLKESKWFVPRSSRVQYAGYIGMLSFGSAWEIKSDKLQIEYSFGFSPKQDAQKTIYANAAKLIYTPRIYVNISERVKVKPVSVALLSSYTFGSRFGKYRDQDKYPDGYYWWSTSVRVGIAYQAELNIHVNSKYINSLGLYLESSVWDLGLFSYYGNSNRSHLQFWDIVILGSGCRVYF